MAHMFNGDTPMQCVMSSHYPDQHNNYTIPSVLCQYTEVKVVFHYKCK